MAGGSEGEGEHRADFGFLVPDDPSLQSIAIRGGSNVVGRADLQDKIMHICNHLTINAASGSEDVEVVVTGANPIVVVSGSTRTKLPPGSTSRLSFGDVVELLPGKLPFKYVKLSDLPSKTDTIGETPSKMVEVSSKIVSCSTSGSVTVNEVFISGSDNKLISDSDSDKKRKRQIEEDEAFARALAYQEAEGSRSPKHLRTTENQATPSSSSDADDLGPCRFRLMRVRGLPDSANEGSVRISDVIQGDIQVAILSNYMVDIEWLLSACPLLRAIPQVVVFHGESNTAELQASKPSNWVLFKPPLRISYGTHHSKAMFLIYSTGVRIAVHTANYISIDWNNKTQGLWMQDFPFKSMTGNMEASAFENDLVDYLTALEWMGCTVNIPGHGELKVTPAYFRSFDYTNAAVRLVASVPGYHSGRHLNKWGHMKLRSILEQEKFDEKFQGSPLVYQFSSLGSLDEKWMEEFSDSLCHGATETNKQLGLGSAQIVFPTVEDVRCSIEGYRAGGAIPSPLKNVQKAFLRKYWSRWIAEHLGRSHAMPHIKTYVRYHNNSLAWFCLTSANLSKAAWGALQKKNTQLMIRSYELGLVFVPSLLRKFKGDDYSCTNGSLKYGASGIHEKNVELCTMQCGTNFRDTRVCRLPVPYALPPPRYTTKDEPWCWDKNYLEPDVFGLAWP